MTLTVTDADGGNAQASLPIAVDRHTDEPIVRVGVPEGETPTLTLHGTARRSDDGALVLPAGAPWGWVQAGAGAIDDLRGLRSVTIQGWLRPESLQVGSGGNRILFGLNTDRAGIDLVCLADGRPRLAVNQWPDAVQNDSSPGRLQVGRWTRFAVTYDATKPEANVGWYFSDPADTPAAARVRLDHHTTYRAGPVGTDIGPLAIGNFNATMQGAGLDRQFRGTIRDVQVFGSRVGGRGALSLETLNAGLTVPPPQARVPALARPRVVVLTDFPPLDVIPVGAGNGPAERNYLGMFWNMRGSDPKLADLDWVNEHLRHGHGVLGAAYPESGANPRTPGEIEGDTPSFLHLVGALRGVNAPERPDQPGWGGRFVRPDATRNHWFDDPASGETVWRWRGEVQADFARRADWLRDSAP